MFSIRIYSLNSNINNIGVRFYTYINKLNIPAGQYKTFTHDCSAIAKTGYTLVPINLGFDSSSSGDSACVLFALLMSGSTLTFSIKNYGTSSANVIPNFQILRIKSV